MDEAVTTIAEYLVVRDTTLITSKGPIHLSHQKFYILDGSLPEILIGQDVLKGKLGIDIDNAVAEMAALRARPDEYIADFFFFFYMVYDYYLTYNWFMSRHSYMLGLLKDSLQRFVCV